MPIELRNKYSNLILLCRNHHKVVDDQVNTFTVDKLKDLKSQHEKWVRQSLDGFDSERQAARELLADYVEKWVTDGRLNGWEAWTSYMLAERPETTKSDVERLERLFDWLFKRIWPKEYPNLRAAFENFAFVLKDLLFQFKSHSIYWQNGRALTDAFYKIDRWDPALYARLHSEYEYHVALVQDLTLELTRAANHVCDIVRHTIDPTFRISEGALIAQSGPYGEDLSIRRHRVEYTPEELTQEHPYPGLEEFRVARATRDFHFDSGLSPS